MKKNAKQSKNVANRNNQNITNKSNNKVTDCNKNNVNNKSNNNNITDLGFADDDDETQSFHLDENDEHSFELR